MYTRIISVLPVLVCLFWGAFLFVRRRKGNRAKSTLALFMAVAALLYLCHAAYFNHLNSAFYDTLYITANLTVYPLYLLYIRRLTAPKKIARREYLIFAVPAVVFLSASVLYLLMPATDTMLFTDNYLYGAKVGFSSSAAQAQAILHRVTPFLFAAEVVYVAIAGIKSIVAYHAELKRYYSSNRGRSMLKIRNLLIAFIVTSFFSMAVNFVGKQYFADNIGLLVLPSLVFSVMLFLLGFVGFRQDFSAEELAAEMLNEHKPLAAMSDATRTELIHGIVDLFENRGVYRNDDYKITDLATALGTNRTYVSTVINSSFGCNFSDYVNRYRIEHAKRLLKAYASIGELPKMSLIYEESGFQSESSFYRIFKEQEGITPRQFLNKR